MSISNSRPRRKFTDEFKAEAVRLVQEADGKVSKIARELGIHDSSLGNWVRNAAAEANGAPSAVERAEIRELKRELERVKRERDILGKATATSLHETRATGDGDLFVHRRGAGHQRKRLVDRGDVSGAESVTVRVLWLAVAAGV